MRRKEGRKEIRERTTAGGIREGDRALAGDRREARRGRGESSFACSNISRHGQRGDNKNRSKMEILYRARGKLRVQGCVNSLRDHATSESNLTAHATSNYFILQLISIYQSHI